jgi:hypothetical protein
MLMTKAYDYAATPAALRVLLLAIFLLGALGTGAELLLLEHTESRWQWVPLLLIGFSLLVLSAHALLRRAATVRLFQLTMLLFVASSIAGLVLHYQGKVEFKLEANPALAGWELFWAAIKGAAVPPVLAPGVMAQLGLLGLAWAYRHPALRAVTPESINNDNKGE